MRVFINKIEGINLIKMEGASLAKKQKQRNRRNKSLISVFE